MKLGIEITLKFFWLNLASWFTKPVVTISGTEYKSLELKWGTHFIELPEGIYSIEILVPNLNIRKEYQVTGNDGKVERISFFANPLKAMI